MTSFIRRMRKGGEARAPNIVNSAVLHTHIMCKPAYISGMVFVSFIMPRYNHQAEFCSRNPDLFYAA